MVTQYHYKDKNLSVEDRVDNLLSLMTLQEKVAQLAGVWSNDLFDPHTKAFVADKARQVIPHGTGHVSRVGAVSMLPPQQSAQLTNQIQHYLINETRLGIPAIVHEESCAGYLAKDATSFPQAIGLAATWEPELVGEMAGIIRRQMRAVGAHLALAPVLDVSRDPRWGRLEETFGEDPFLVTQLGLAYVQNLQTDDWTQGIIATAKHFIGYSLPEGGMNWAPTHLTERMIREVFLPPFAAVIQKGNIGAVMNGYQEIDGIPCGSSTELLVDLLRDELGFTGPLVSDYFTVNMLVKYHHIAETKAQAAHFALKAAIDVELPDADCYGQPLLTAVERGDIGLDLVDASVRRVLNQKIQLGLFERPYVDVNPIPEIYTNPDNIALSRKLAQKSIVLLENKQNCLPLSRKLNSIAVIGPNADSTRNMQGDYHYPSHMEGIIDLGEEMDAPSPTGEDRVVKWEQERPPTTTVLQAIRNAVSDRTTVHFARGCDVIGTNKSGFDEAVKIAQSADVAVVVVGDRSGLSKDSTSGEAVDRATLELPGVQQELVLAVAETGTPTIVVILNGRPPVLTEIADHVSAILLGWLPAQEGGNAIADILFGDVAPGGKLPVTLPRHVGQVPVYYAHKPSGGRSHWHGEYRDMSTTPLYPFGYGLSYTTFNYSNLSLSHTSASATDTVTVSFDLTNTGSVAGEEVVQLYIADPIASVTRPVKQLKAFKRAHLEAGQTCRITFELPMAHFAFYDRSMNYVVEAGTVSVMIGSSSQDIHLNGDIEISATEPVQQVFTTDVKVTYS